MLTFGTFELDLENRELRRQGVAVPLQPQPFKVLSLLATNAGRLVTRDEIRTGVWGPGTFLDFDQSLNYCIRRIRSALDDDVSAPRYVETRQRIGYRFIAPVSETSALHQRAISDKVMLAVLPFQNLSGDSEQDYFSDGLTEELTTQLGRLNPQRLGVIARTSAMRYKCTTETAGRIGQQLGVNYLLDGSARRAGSRVRIAAQLIQASDETHIWAESYERDVGDILAIQTDVARAVAREIQLTLSTREQNRLAGRRPIEHRAIDAYLRGRYCWNKRSHEALEQSIRYFESAIEADSRYAEAYTGLADCYLRMLDFSYMPATEAIDRARMATDTALALDETLAEAHTSLGHRSFHEFKWMDADRAFRRAIDLNPNYGVAYYYYSNFLTAMARFPEAIEEADRAQEIDLLSPATRVNTMLVLHFAGHYDRALEEAQAVLEIEPSYTRVHYYIGLVQEQLGQYDRAIDSFRKAPLGAADTFGPRAALAHAYGLARDKRNVRALAKEIEQIAASSYVSPYDFVLLHLALGDNDAAMDWLARAYEQRSSHMAFVRSDLRLAPLHSDVRFSALVRSMGFPTQCEIG